GRDGGARVCPVESRFFFFQAEDGIRDGHVTGVQTCALPIFVGLFMASIFPTMLSFAGQQLKLSGHVTGRFIMGASAGAMIVPLRSEERRVGKECRSRWEPDPQKKRHLTAQQMSHTPITRT